MKHPIGLTKNGILVNVDLVQSSAAAQIAFQPHLLGMVKEILAVTTAKGPMVAIEQDMGRIVGHNYVIKTSETDTIFYAQLARDPVFMRFVKNGKPKPTKYVTIMMILDDNKEYQLENVRMGRARPSPPGSKTETPASKEYWQTHAHVFDKQQLQVRSITKVCPY